MKKRIASINSPQTWLGIILTTLLLTSNAPAFAADNLKQAFAEGDFGYSFRWRLETVDQDPLPHNALAIPLRARIHYQTADLYGFSAKVELDYIFDFGLDSYNAGGGNTPDPVGYPVIADPEGGDLNQLFLQYRTKSDGLFRLGRQRIIYDNARFIGNVGWRQNEQTYDAFAIDQKTTNGWQFQYAYLDQVERVFGNDSPIGKYDLNTNLFNIAYDLENIGKLTGYYYALENQDVATQSNTSMGMFIAGQHGAGKAQNDKTGPVVGYRLEYAHQTEYANNPINYAADYWRGDLSVDFKWATPYVGYESLGASDEKPGHSFQTPLATLHAFNGWADKFLVTPPDGLNDAFIGIKGKAGVWNWDMIYHNFTAESGPEDYGTEFDGSIGRKFKERFGIVLKAAFFESDSNSIVYGDTTKFWLQFTADL